MTVQSISIDRRSLDERVKEVTDIVYAREKFDFENSGDYRVNMADGELAVALEKNTAFIKGRPGEAAHMFNRAVIFCGMGCYSQALECAEKAAAVEPGLAEAWYLSGLLKTLNYLRYELKEPEDIELYEYAFDFHKALHLFVKYGRNSMRDICSSVMKILHVPDEAGFTRRDRFLFDNWKKQAERNFYDMRLEIAV